jgi:hypothetical protein
MGRVDSDMTEPTTRRAAYQFVMTGASVAILVVLITVGVVAVVAARWHHYENGRIAECRARGGEWVGREGCLLGH